MYLYKTMARNIGFIPEEKVQQALEVFCEKGYSATTLEDLVQAMQINKSSLYNSFKDKHSLFKECLRAYGKITEEDYRTAAHKKNGLSPLEMIDSIIDKITDRIIEDSNSCLCISASFELASRNEDVRTIIKKTNENTIKLIQMLLKEAQAHKELPEDRNCHYIAHLIFSTLSGLWYNYKVYQDEILIKQIAEELKVLLKN